MTFGIYVPSYKRSDSIMTYHVFDRCTYMVRKSEEQNYLKAGIAKKDLWAVEDDLINGGAKAYYYIIEHAKEDMIVIADDDISGFMYMLREVELIDGDDKKEIINAEIERIAQMIADLEIGMGMLGPNAIPYNYDREIAFKGVPGAVKWINRKVFRAKLDNSVLDNYDLDMVMQELLHNRIVFYPKYLYDYGGKMDKTKGGDSVGKTRGKQLDSIMNMKAKWGKYFKYDLKKNKPQINVSR